MERVHMNHIQEIIYRVRKGESVETIHRGTTHAKKTILPFVVTGLLSTQNGKKPNFLTLWRCQWFPVFLSEHCVIICSWNLLHWYTLLIRFVIPIYIDPQSVSVQIVKLLKNFDSFFWGKGAGIMSTSNRRGEFSVVMKTRNNAIPTRAIPVNGVL